MGWSVHRSPADAVLFMRTEIGHEALPLTAPSGFSSGHFEARPVAVHENGALAQELNKRPSFRVDAVRDAQLGYEIVKAESAGPPQRIDINAPIRPNLELAVAESAHPPRTGRRQRRDPQAAA